MEELKDFIALLTKNKKLSKMETQLEINGVTYQATIYRVVNTIRVDLKVI